MASVKDAIDCIGLDSNGDISVLGDLFGFLRRRVPTDPDATVTASVSLLDHLENLQGKTFHYNVIRTGIDEYSDADVDRIDYAVYKSRNIFKARSLQVGRVQHFNITTAESDGLHIIASEDEATELTNNWSVDNDGLDTFVVDQITSPDFIGISNINGPCDKDSKGRTGSIVALRDDDGIDRTDDGFARTFSHEMGHYLGLSHKNDVTDNLMCQTKFADSERDSIVITSSQGTDIRDHCSVSDGC